MFRACTWKVCLDAAKVIEVRRISFLSYGRYKIQYLNIFELAKCKFAFGILQSTENNFGKQTQRKMKEGSMPDEQLKAVLENSASAVMRFAIDYRHFALIPMETEILW